MWIVKLALKNPYSLGVLAAFIFLIGLLSIVSMRIDILPEINIPVVNVIWQYNGLAPEEMENRVVFVAERGYTTSVNGIQKMESHSIPGIGLIRLYFDPSVEIGAAIAQITSSSMTSLRVMPPGMQPPVIVQFNASNVPVAQLTMSSQSVPEEKLFDYAQNFVRMKLFSLPGLATPAPYGGKSRQINIDIRPELLAARGLSSQDVVTTLGNSNIIIPAGTSRIGNLEYSVLMNSSPTTVQEFNDLPVKSLGSRTITLGEVATITDAFADQTNVVRIDGHRATFLNLLKKSDASTLKVVQEVKDALTDIKATAPPGMDFKIDFDQSIYVKAAVMNVLSEALIAAGLVSLMILIFLGSARSVFIVCTSIPLSILVSIVTLRLLGQTLNTMTLGGLSLAIGMLVDDATVEIENINRNVEKEPSIVLAILRGASQVALPAIMSTLAICIVFSPIVLLTGPAKYLFMPLAGSVVFAMLASYVLSRSLVPVLAKMLLNTAEADKNKKKSRLGEWSDRYNEWRERKLDDIKEGYRSLLEVFIDQKIWIFGFFTFLVLISCALPFFVIGRDFFPVVDAGLMKLHYRARSGTRIEETEKQVAQVENRIRALIPKNELQTVNSSIGTPASYNLAYVASDNIGAMDAEIQIALEKKHRPSLEYQEKLRQDLKEKFPGATIYFQPADLMNQVLNFGVPSMLDIQVQAKQSTQGFDIAQKLQEKIKKISGAVDVHLNQVFDYPTLKVKVDRIRASRLGLTQKDVAANLLISLSSSSLYAPSFFLNKENNVNYFVVAKAPLVKITSVEDLLRTPVTTLNGGGSQTATAMTNETPLSEYDNRGFVQAPRAGTSEMLGNLASLDTGTTMDEIDHHDIQRVVDIMGGVQGRDLGGVVSDVQQEIKDMGNLPAGVKISVLGQSEVMQEAFKRLGLGLIIAILLVYLLMVTLFQSWLDPLIVLLTLPGALAGVMWMLALTNTTLNVVSMMGAIMAVGIAVSNSILMVSFANELRAGENLDATAAALEAAATRLRPVSMTALAMILGMLPMSLGLGEAGAQNAPLGRAVIGGLIVATLGTLFLVPLLYSVMRQAVPRKNQIRQEIQESEEIFDQEQVQLTSNQGVKHGSRPREAPSNAS